MRIFYFLPPKVPTRLTTRKHAQVENRTIKAFLIFQKVMKDTKNKNKNTHILLENQYINDLSLRSEFKKKNRTIKYFM